MCIDLNFFGIDSLFPTYETFDLPNETSNLNNKVMII